MNSSDLFHPKLPLMAVKTSGKRKTHTPLTPHSFYFVPFPRTDPTLILPDCRCLAVALNRRIAGPFGKRSRPFCFRTDNLRIPMPLGGPYFFIEATIPESPELRGVEHKKAQLDRVNSVLELCRVFWIGAYIMKRAFLYYGPPVSCGLYSGLFWGVPNRKRFYYDHLTGMMKD